MSRPTDAEIAAELTRRQPHYDALAERAGTKRAEQSREAQTVRVVRRGPPAPSRPTTTVKVLKRQQEEAC